MKIHLKRRGDGFPSYELYNEQYIVLQWDSWNDYTYFTTFPAFLVTETDGIRQLGHIKIMKMGQQIAQRTFPIGTTGLINLNDTNNQYCSLGINIDFYKKLLDYLGFELAKTALSSLRDAATDGTIRKSFEEEPCFKISLLREIESRIALDEAGSLFGISSDLTNSFSVTTQLPDANEPHVFNFNFNENNGLPHRMQILVGLNGVGKTQMMARLAMLMSRFSKKNNKEKKSVLDTEGIGMLSPVPSIYNVVAISFSAFDEFERPTILQGEKFNYSYCGLRTARGRLLTENDLLDNIKRIVTEELDDQKKIILTEIIGNLIKVENIHSFIFDPEQHIFLYEKLSAGQRIALNALLHTLAKIENRTLILFDEPELHLHPQLLTTMINSFYKILRRYDSFAILATHSPIVVQQVPSHCVHIVLRERNNPHVAEPLNELFGENLSEITRQVFMATESDRDFRSFLDELLVNNNYDSKIIESFFPKGLGLSAQIYLASREQSHSQNIS